MSAQAGLHLRIASSSRVEVVVRQVTPGVSEARVVAQSDKMAVLAFLGGRAAANRRAARSVVHWVRAAAVFRGRQHLGTVVAAVITVAELPCNTLAAVGALATQAA